MMTEVPPFTPLIVHERGQIASVLAARRVAMGMTCEAFDHHVGWADRYVTKLEHSSRPQGRQGLHFGWPAEAVPGGSIRCTGMSELWLQALGLRLVLVDEATAGQIGAVPAPVRAPLPVLNRSHGSNAKHHAAARQTKGRAAAISMSQVEALDRTLVARESFKAAVAEHPFVQSHPDLQAEADAIGELLAAFYTRIRASE